MGCRTPAKVEVHSAAAGPGWGPFGVRAYARAREHRARRLIRPWTVKCHCCGGTAASRDGGEVICVRCVMELESCRPITLLRIAPAAE
jgi:hypothetical protein